MRHAVIRQTAVIECAWELWQNIVQDAGFSTEIVPSTAGISVVRDYTNKRPRPSPVQEFAWPSRYEGPQLSGSSRDDGEVDNHLPLRLRSARDSNCSS